MAGAPDWLGKAAEWRHPWADQRILVAGGVGFIGRVVAEFLVKLGARDVTVISRRAAEAPAGCRVALVDLNDRQATCAAFSGRRFDLVINAAGKIDQSTNRTIYRDSFDVNFFTALNLVQALQDGAVGRFIHLGSNAEYGNAPCPQSAATKEQPNTAYGVAKLAATDMVVAKAFSESFPACVVRPFLVYGSGQGAFSFLSHAINGARARREFPTTPGEQTRDFVSAEKVAYDVLSLAAAPTFTTGAVYNSCTGVETRLRDVLCHLQARHPGFSPRFGALPYRRGELMRSVGEALHPVAAEEARRELFAFLDRETGLTDLALAG
jgi:dTDP-6-deoxy-L-talose 4-dehydrogenase [NAD(P)+]